MRLLLRLLINAAALWVAVKILPGIHFTGDWLALPRRRPRLRNRQRVLGPI